MNDVSTTAANSSSTGNGADKRKQLLAIACILAAGTLWGCLGLFNRGLSALGIAPTTIVLLRNFGACAILAVFFLCRDRSIFRIRLRHLPIFLCSGLISILCFTICYFYSQQVSSLAVAAILLYTAPAFVVVFSALIWKDKITKRKLAALIIAFLGCCFVAGILNGSLAVSRLGLIVGIGSGLFYSSYTIFGRFALKHYQPFTVTFYTFLIAGIGSLFLVDYGDVVRTVHDGRAVLLALGLMLLGTVFPYILYTKGLSDLGDSGKASILASIEPVVAAIVGIIAFGEPMTVGVALGLLCILTSVYILR